ncbi:UNVERIFIED_CONTAM: hypothetical protein Sradi_4910400 [Sesamum radiatum]|uniref:Uncharacterized protein n=1 Tax=Sesamum radiatum TaxID=300843 RepID=A0AAW2MCJ9_SESRA
MSLQKIGYPAALTFLLQQGWGFIEAELFPLDFCITRAKGSSMHRWFRSWGARGPMEALALLTGVKTGSSWHFPIGSSIEAELAGVEEELCRGALR